MYKAIIFDLDGTLLDTLTDLAASCNAALKMMGFPARTVEEVRSFVGNGLEMLVRRALPEGAEEETVRETLKKLKEYYALHNRDKTMPYEGILPMLRQLKEAGVPCCILSNKNDPNVQSLCEVFFDGLYSFAAGETDTVRRKPAPDGVFRLCSLLGVAKQEVCLVGDSEVDVETAQAAGVDLLAVSWGFRSEQQLRKAGAEQIFSTPETLLKHLLA